MNKWGRDELEWNELVAETSDFLAEQARLGRTTSYTELNSVLAGRTHMRPFDFDRESERAAIGAMLGEVALERLADVGALVTAIVIYLNENDAGSGFYRLATSLGLLPASPSAAAKFDFWVQQVRTVHAHYQ